MFLSSLLLNERMSWVMAILANAVHNCFENIQIRAIQLRHGTGQLRGMLRVHVESFSASSAGHVQMGVTAFRAHILVIGLSAAWLY